MRLVGLTSSNLIGLMSEIEYLLPDKRDRAEFHARLAINLFGLAYSYRHSVMLSTLTDKQRKDVEASIAEMMRDAADVMDAKKFELSEVVR